MPTKKKSRGVSDAPPAPPTPYKCPVSASHLLRLSPLTPSQSAFMTAYAHGTPCLLLHGMAGTGKTFIAVYKALQDVLMTPVQPPDPPRRVILIRSAVPSRDIGFLPGDDAEKMAVYQAPYRDICAKLVQHPQGYQKLVDQKRLEFWSTSFLRGVTIDDAVVIVDECQNMADMELHTIMTRMGKRSRIVWCGDFRQTDLVDQRRRSDGIRGSDLRQFMTILRRMPSHRFHQIEFGVDDIVRSELVREYLIARDQLDLS